MAFQLMAFQIHLRLEDDKLGIQTLLVKAEEVVLLKVVLKRIVVDVILLLPVGRPSIADVAALVPVAAVSVELIIPIEPLPTEPALRMASESALVNGTGDIISIPFVPAQLGCGKEFVLVCEYLFVSRAQVTCESSAVMMASGQCDTNHITFPCLLLT